jgi:hypothetical protein
MNPIYSDNELPRYANHPVSLEIIKRFGSLRYWCKLRGYKYGLLHELLHGRTQGKRGKSGELKRQLVKEGLWREPNEPKSAAQ